MFHTRTANKYKCYSNKSLYLRHHHTLTQYGSLISKRSLFAMYQTRLPSSQNLEPQATGNMSLNLMKVGTFKSIDCVSFLRWRAWMKGRKEIRWRRGRSLCRCGHVEREEYWEVCNGTSLKAVSYDLLFRKKCYISTAQCARRGVCLMNLHTPDDARSLTFSNNVFLFL